MQNTRSSHLPPHGHPQTLLTRTPSLSRRVGGARLGLRSRGGSGAEPGADPPPSFSLRAHRAPWCPQRAPQRRGGGPDLSAGHGRGPRPWEPATGGAGPGGIPNGTVRSERSEKTSGISGTHRQSERRPDGGSAAANGASGSSACGWRWVSKARSPAFPPAQPEGPRLCSLSTRSARRPSPHLRPLGFPGGHGASSPPEHHHPQSPILAANFLGLPSQF